MKASQTHMETSMFHMETSLFHMETSQTHMETSMFHMETSHSYMETSLAQKNYESCVGSQTFVQLVASLVPAEWGWAPAEGVSGVAWGSSFQLVHKHRQFMQLVNNIGSSCS